MHLPDRVMLQFGLNQHIPLPPHQIPAKLKSSDLDTYIAMWDEREDRVVHQHHEVSGPNYTRNQYLVWYWKITRRWITNKPPVPLVTCEPRAPIERSLV